MLVDDDAGVRQLLRATLDAEGWAIVEASDGAAALALADATRPDLVVLDWRMPGLSGPEVLTRLKQRHPAIRVILLTAASEPRYGSLAAVFGADAYLTKPFSPLRLLEVIEALLGQRDGDSAS